jgi:EmrB/QacA subfamily drug resistance transporter
MENMTGNRDRRWLGLFAVLAATIMNILDSTIVNVAAPSIRADLGGSYASLQWIAAAYTLALAVGLLTGGRLGDMFGRKRVILIGTTGFVAASVLCAAAWSPATLIGARVLQGLFGAVMVPQTFGLIRDLFPPKDIGKAFGALGPVIGLSTIAGPVVAGLLIQADIAGSGWRAAFLINLPIGVFSLLAGVVALPSAGAQPGLVLGVGEHPPVDAAARDRGGRMDGIGALTAGVGMLMLVYPLTMGREKGWPAWLLAILGGAVAVLAGFVARQIRRRRTGRTTLIELSLFTRRSYVSGVVFVIVFFGAIVGFSLSTGLFLQLGLGYSPMRASLTMCAWAIGAFLGSAVSAGLMARLGRRMLHIGLTLMGAGLVGLILTLGNGPAGVGGWALRVPLGVYGLGMGMIFVPLFDIIMGEVRDHEVGSASSLLESLQQLGASLGVAILGTVFFAAVGAQPLIGDFVHASQRIALLALALTAIAFGLAFLLPRKARAHTAPVEPAEPIESAGPAPVGSEPVLV